MHPLVELKDVSVVRDGKKILDIASLMVMPGEHVAIVGPNGAGKSTLIKVMTREIHPHGGRGVVSINEERASMVRDVRVDLAAVSAEHESLVIGKPTVRELILSGFFGSFGVLFGHNVEPKMEERAKLLMAMMEISPLAERPLETLSSGERRRAWIARALAPKPAALVLDEPTNNLDIKIAREFSWLLRRISQTGVTLILVTHHFTEIIPEIGRVILLRDGKIFDDGPRDEVLREQNIDALYSSAAENTEWKNPTTAAEYVDAMRNIPVYDVALRTPLDQAPMLSNIVGSEVWLKREDLQPVFSFKLRGAYALMSNLPPELLATWCYRRLGREPRARSRAFS